ncbi:unnamed protein product [Phytophthora fragariaefolia]|uniref:Unnamed protein product n=1 Tax=Phytophthora fragariaefolia TaxID=1490495 RepID=A0A9W6X5I8_9STRA|nr:unnamed protein product [Phytophthora fragariaefolia]
MRRLPGGGRRPYSAAMEEALYDESVAKRLRKEKVTRAWTSHMVKVIYASHHSDDAVFGGFTASPHWITGFMRRYGLSLRHEPYHPDGRDARGARGFLQKFHRSTLPAMYLNRTILMDETAVYFEAASNQTVDITGSRHVVVRSTGFSSMRITAVLAVSATSSKLPPLLIWKGKASPTFTKIGGMYVAYQLRAWVDSTLLKRWIDLASPLVDMREGKHMVWDSMRPHISNDAKAKCATPKINMCVIPRGLTPYLQADDIGIYKTFKDLLYMEINAWKESDKVEYTRFGNPRMPAVAVVCEWVRKACRDTDSNTVINLISAAGFADSYLDWHVAKHDVYGVKFCTS